MSVFKSICFSLLIGVLFSCNMSFAQEDMSADDLFKKGEQYYERKDYQQSMQYLLKAADKGDARAMAGIGVLYYQGLGVKQDEQQAMQWFLRAESTGDADAMFFIGVYYDEGIVIKQDYQQAMQWYLKAADKGSTDAMWRIGTLYKNGYGVKQDYQQAIQWRKKSKEAEENLLLQNMRTH